ncbi:YlzJ-like family protein [Alkalihalobacillus trypoxylicola]|uniref:Uncharacterized protein n=1 Tax=Alkalihalobacillus trypoxylicola TaxID=519424 RepID=A0A162F7Z3_9BACI|nr:YlzJ-like family protein [Alkalihalobacillus trypoxylicola]KYG35002.1 hypothetical protein AZF04_01315 [Alkalihalobacillus trypoxylicola]GAF63593.1 hypothetical protein BTS2_0484 [Bacillus sp. TS-2]
MILYTMMPHEQVFSNDEQSYTQYVTLPVKDGHLIVEKVNHSDYQIVRLLSTNPMSYLNNEYTPGTIIQMF